MKLRPILFSTPMVLALLAGTKTQTRRKVKPQPENERFYIDGPKTDGQYLNVLECGYKIINCRYQVGDVLWVRETWTELVGHHRTENERYVYRANPTSDADSEEIRQGYIKAGFPYKWKSSMFMPFAACRLFLELTAIRVERLQAITEEDAIAEGVHWYALDDPTQTDYKNYLHKGTDDWGFVTARDSYFSLWDSINGKDSSESNPFVWVYEFKVVDKPVQT